MNSNQEKKPKLLVVVHDAGGAEIIGAYIRKTHKRAHFVVYAGGPARAILKRERIPFLPEPQRTELRSILLRYRGAQALFGTGGPRSIELVALKEAKRQGMKTAAYIDSWTNYRERFIDSWTSYSQRFVHPARGWRKNLPDEIWAGDIHAVALAKKYFSPTRVRFVQNQYFADIVARYRSRARQKRAGDILFLSASGLVSQKLFADFLAECSRLAVTSVVRVRIHPADSRTRYERIIRRHGRGIRVVLSREKGIVEDIIHARAAVGPETNALVPALLVGIETIRIVPYGEKPFLPFEGIVTVKSGKSAACKLEIDLRHSVKS